MDWETLYCPNRSCRFYDLPCDRAPCSRTALATAKKQALCRACGRSVYLRYGTAYFELDTDPANFETAIRALAEGNGVRGTARIVETDKDTASAWLDRAAKHCRRVLLYLWHDLHVTECQLDELWSFVHTKEEHLLEPSSGVRPMVGKAGARGGVSPGLHKRSAEGLGNPVRRRREALPLPGAKPLPCLFNKVGA
jgi:transposase-like protein